MSAADTEKKNKTSSMNDDPESVFRIYSVLSYFIVLVVIGIPIWWYTTRVYRANLPLSEMYNVALVNKNDSRPFGIPLSLDYDVLVTIVNPDPEKLELDIDGEDIDTNLHPFLQKVSSIADFTIKSQWLYLSELGAIPRKIIDHYALQEEQLPHIITPLEKKLWSHLSPRPCLHLVLYVSQCEVPLYIYNKEGGKVGTNSFLSPRWGGIYILNPNGTACKNHKFKPDLEQITSTFISLLMKLLDMKSDSDEDLVALKRQKAQDMVHSTRRTLKSLAQLLSEINSIVISDDVADRIRIAVDNAAKAENLLTNNQITEALKYARIAFKNSEEAFSDPSLLALLYFPDDQKYAVYIPLFLPVMIPVLMSLITVRKWYRGQKTKQD